MSSASHFAFSGSNGSGIDNFFNVIESSDSFQKSDGFFGFFDGFDVVVNNKWELRDICDSVSSGHDQRSDSGCGDGGRDGVSFVFDVYSSVPMSPGVEGSEHSSFTTHVSEGGLSGSVGTRTRNSWNTSDGSTSTPGFGGVFHTGFWVNSVGLSSIFGDIHMDELDDIVSDWSGEDGWEVNLS